MLYFYIDLRSKSHSQIKTCKTFHSVFFSAIILLHVLTISNPLVKDFSGYLLLANHVKLNIAFWLDPNTLTPSFKTVNVSLTQALIHLIYNDVCTVFIVYAGSDLLCGWTLTSGFWSLESDHFPTLHNCITQCKQLIQYIQHILKPITM